MNRILWFVLGILFLGSSACNGGQKENTPSTGPGSADTSAVVQTTDPDTTATAATDTLTVLEGRRWKIQSLTYEGTEIQPDREVEAFFTFSNGRVFGSTGCNNFNGSYEIKGPNGVTVGQLATTKKMCPSLMVQERRILDLIQNATGFEALSRRFLEIQSAKGKITVTTEESSGNDYPAKQGNG